MISWVVIMLLFWHYQKLAQLDPQIINDKVFVRISYLLDKIYQYITIINDFLSSSIAFNFYITKN